MKEGIKMAELSHIDQQGHASMVDVGDKPPMKRTAIAEGYFVAAQETIDKIMTGNLPKGEAMSVARIAGIQAAKGCDQLIPLCHSLGLDYVQVNFERADPGRIRVSAEARLTAKTGVEMEALTAVSVACLTLYDMTKAVDKTLRIEGILLLKKTKERV